MESSETNTLQLDKKFAVRILAYTAGLLDGEGCITGSGHYVQVFISGSNKEMIAWLKETYGGGYVNWNCNPRGRRVEKWMVPSKSITPFLKLMIPFLRIKRKQLYKAMSIRSMIERKADKTRIARAIQQLQALNQAR